MKAKGGTLAAHPSGPTGAPAAAAMRATKTIPIVLGASPDPVEAGFVTSHARPGGNITGMSWMSSELAGKRLEILREIAPHVMRVANIQPGPSR
jgi:putative tryptophan/tyrosine transport system substrate-binding protein